MRFKPMSEEDAARLWPKGEYDAVVKSAVEKTSQSSGNDMIELTLTVYGAGGKTIDLRDWLVSTDGGQAKIQRFCKAAGLWDDYERGELSAEVCRDCNVVVKLGVQPGDDNYPPRNKVADYISQKPVVETPKSLPGVPASQRSSAGTGRADPTQPPTSDDIPFAWLVGFVLLAVSSGILA